MSIKKYFLRLIGYRLFGIFIKNRIKNTGNILLFAFLSADCDIYYRKVFSHTKKTAAES